MERAFFRNLVDTDSQLHYLVTVPKKRKDTPPNNPGNRSGSMMPLSECPRGSTVRIVRLCEDKGCRCRLCSMGLTPGVEATVCEGGECCRLRVRVGEICLGAGLAERVLVSPL